jgi:hypothetical protein
MATSKFKIARLPIRSSLFISGVPVVLNQLYPISSESNLVVITNGIGTPYDSYEFQLVSDTGESTLSYTCTINTAAAIGVVNTNNQSFNVPKNEKTSVPVVFESTVGKVIFLSYGNKKGNILIEGDEVVLGQTYQRYQLDNIEYITTYPEDGINITTLVNMQKFNDAGLSETVTVSFVSTANISSSIAGASIVTGILTNATP